MGSFERKFGKYAIPNLSLLLIICYAFGYLIQRVNPGFIYYLTLNLVPPDPGSNLFFVAIMLYFYYSIGTQLERTWGTYFFNVYIFGGFAFTILGAFLLMGCCYLFRAEQIAFYGEAQFFQLTSLYTFSTYYVNMSIFLAYAATFPDMQVLLMFIFPIRVKWLGIIYGAMLAFECVTGGFYQWFAIGASLLNFVVFFFMTKKRLLPNPRQQIRRMRFTREARRGERPYGGISKHKCAICGRTEVTHPELSFRFCSKCRGNYEYCQDHLFTHRHVE